MAQDAAVVDEQAVVTADAQVADAAGPSDTSEPPAATTDSGPALDPAETTADPGAVQTAADPGAETVLVEETAISETAVADAGDDVAPSPPPDGIAEVATIPEFTDVAPVDSGSLPADTTADATILDVTIVEVAPTDSTPDEAIPSDTPADTIPADTTPVDTTPVDVIPADTAPVHTTPVEVAVFETAPADDPVIQVTPAVAEEAPPPPLGEPVAATPPPTHTTPSVPVPVYVPPVPVQQQPIPAQQPPAPTTPAPETEATTDVPSLDVPSIVVIPAPSEPLVVPSPPGLALYTVVGGQIVLTAPEAGVISGGETGPGRSSSKDAPGKATPTGGGTSPFGPLPSDSRSPIGASGGVTGGSGSGAGTAGGFAALLAILGLAGALGLGRRLQLSAVIWRPVAFSSPLERPG